MSTSTCNNMFMPDIMEYVGDSYDAIVRNFACLDTRACNLVTKGEGYVTMGSTASSLSDFWTSPASAVSANGAGWSDFANVVFWTSAFWLGPITVVYANSLPPGSVTQSSILQWLTTTFEPSSYLVDQQVVVQTAVLNQDPAIHNTTYEWTIGLGLTPTFVNQFACFRFILTQETGNKRWTVMDHCNTIGKPFPPQTCSNIYGQFRGWSSCNVPVLSAASTVQPYYMLTDCAKVVTPCYFPASGGHYDSYVGRIVHIEGSNVDYILSRVFPPTVPSNICSGSLIVREVCEATSCPETCYSLTPATSAGLVACGSLTTYRNLADYIGKYVRILNSDLCWFVQKAPYCGCAVDVTLHDDYCFELQDCKGCATSLWAKTDLHKYENQIVMIEGYPQRWIVIGHNCPNLAGSCVGDKDKRISVVVTKTFATCDEPCPCPAVSVIEDNSLDQPFTEQSVTGSKVVTEPIFEPTIVDDVPWWDEPTTAPPTTTTSTTTTTTTTTTSTTTTTTSTTPVPTTTPLPTTTPAPTTTPVPTTPPPPTTPPTTTTTAAPPPPTTTTTAAPPPPPTTTPQPGDSYDVISDGSGNASGSYLDKTFSGQFYSFTGAPFTVLGTVCCAPSSAPTPTAGTAMLTSPGSC